MRRQAKKFAKGSPSDGSALILTVVLTSMLAIMGVLFVMMARVNQIATSGISESKELDSAIETVIAKISEELVLDVPGVSTANLDYYDYPGSNDEWLASLEPYEKTAGNYYWRQISDVTGYIEKEGWDTQDIEINSNAIIEDHEEIELDNDGNLEDQLADADGDGVADSKWIELDDITSSKGKPIYAAIRIIDNGGMLNVNTAYKFDPDGSREEVDGSTQMQINLFALSERGSTSDPLGKLDEARYGDEPHNLNDYIRDVVWHYDRPDGNYTPFDISDELELRYRFLVNHPDIDTRIEEVWDNVFQSPNLRVPVDSNLQDWFYRVQHDVVGPNDVYSYRHIGTTYNMDRIINPSGYKMLNINTVASANDVYSTIREALTDDPNADVNDIAAQITVNLIDFRDNDSNVTSINVGGSTYYGFERPCVYISELAHKFVEVPNPIPGEPNIIYKSYAIELYKPYLEDNDPNNWRLVIDGNPIGIDWSLGSRLFHVIRFEDPNTPAPLTPLLDVSFDDTNDPPDPNHSRSPYDGASYGYHFDANSVISLQRVVYDVNGIGIDIVVDSIRVPDPNGGWLAIDGSAHSIQRDITLHKCIRRLWDSAEKTPTLGRHNSFEWPPDSVYIQAHPANSDFTNVGEIGMLFREDVYNRTWDSADTEADVRLNLADFRFQQIFNYLTVFDPTVDGIDNNGDGHGTGANVDPNELKIPGRININTAPWYVLAQLPWVSQRKTFSTYELAKEIVGYRDEIGSFESIGQLCQVGIYDSNDYRGIDYYARDLSDLDDYPDLSVGDGAEGDFEERDVIFARISNLVTVRSDVFTAYILVRIGTDGPQKRVIAILGRSDVYLPTDRVKIVAVHPVADPR